MIDYISISGEHFASLSLLNFLKKVMEKKNEKKEEETFLKNIKVKKKKVLFKTLYRIILKLLEGISKVI